MDQLTTSDAMFLYMENATNYGHVGGLQVLDSPTVPKVREGQELEDHMEAFLQMVPYARRRMVELPLKLGHPVWINDPDFDLEFHIRQTAVPSPGTPQQVEQVASRIASRPLDRSRPLWEMYEMEGLDGGTKSGNFSKTHHCAADGAAFMAIALATLTITPEIINNPRPDTIWEPDRIPSQLELMARGARNTIGQPGRSLSWARRMVREIAELVGKENEFRARLPELVAETRNMRSPQTRFSGMLGPHRRWAYGSTSLDELRAIKSAFGVTLNDVVLAICAGALRKWMLERQELPDESLIAMVPVNIRESEATTDGGNSVSSAAGVLHTDIADPIERLGCISDSMNKQKLMQKAVSATAQMEALELMAPWAMFQAMQLAYRTRQSARSAPFNLTISNVPGPQYPVYVDGAQQLASYPFSTIADGMGLNITVCSYNGQLDWGIVSDRDMVDDLWPMWDDIQTAQAELLALIP